MCMCWNKQRPIFKVETFIVSIISFVRIHYSLVSTSFSRSILLGLNIYIRFDTMVSLFYCIYQHIFQSFDSRFNVSNGYTSISLIWPVIVLSFILSVLFYMKLKTNQFNFNERFIRSFQNVCFLKKHCYRYWIYYSVFSK